jgi:CheY-like chemotaxis protein
MQTADAGPTRRILVVDDEPALRTLCQRLVWSLGHECEVAESSVAVSRLVSEGWFDVILCVITSGATTDSDVVALADRYGLTLISKPYGTRELASAIDLVASGPVER